MFFIKASSAQFVASGGDEESPIFASQISTAQRPNTSYSVPASQHSLIKQSTRLFYLTVRAFRSSTLRFTSRLFLHFIYLFKVLSIPWWR